jgi:hypothetical protein
MFMIATIKQYHWVLMFVTYAIFIFVVIVIQLQNSLFSVIGTSYVGTISFVEGSRVSAVG